MSKILLVDIGDTKLTSQTLGIVEAVFEEAGFDTDNVSYSHLPGVQDLSSLPQADIVVALGAEATKHLCKTNTPLSKYAGCLTYNRHLASWVLPTMHPNGIYQEKYGDFDVTYDHLRRAVDLSTGLLSLPPVDGERIDWEFIGHNGVRGFGGDPSVWSGYFEATQEEIARAWYILDLWMDDLSSGGITPIVYGLDTESYTTDHLKPLTMIQVYDPIREKGFAFTWGVVSELRSMFQEFFAHFRSRFVLHNTKHDRKMLKFWLDVDLGDKDDDTMCWAMGLTEKSNQLGLKYLSRQFANAPFYEESLDEWLDKDDINYGHIRPDVLAEYGCYDVYYTRKLLDILPPLVDREGTRELVEKLLLPAQRTLSEPEYAGMLFDREYAASISQKWTPLIEEAIRKVQEYARSVGFPADQSVTKSQASRGPCDCVPVRLHSELVGLRCTSWGKFLREVQNWNPECGTCNRKRYVLVRDDTLNVRSSTQMAHLCHDMLEMIPTHEPRKCNKLFWAVNADHEFAKLVLDYRELDYLLRNFVDGMERFIASDGRVHPDFLLFGTTSGRLAVRNPALQTIPSRSANAKYIKRMFLPDEDCVIVNADYKSLEMFVTQHLTKDPVLLDDLLTKDVYKATAMDMFRKAYEEVTAEERQYAKPVVLGAGYNMKGGKLSKNPDVRKITGGNKRKAQDFLDAFWNRYAVWNSVKEGWKREAVDNCELRTEFGRVRRWSLVTNDNKWKVENQATNFKSQSVGSDITLTSVIRLQKQLTHRGWGRVMLTVHDSVVASIKKEHVHAAVRLINQVMCDVPIETETPFSVDIEVGLNYGDVVAYDPDTNYTEW